MDSIKCDRCKDKAVVTNYSSWWLCALCWLKEHKYKCR